MNERFSSARCVARVELAQEPEFALGSLRVNPRHCEVTGSGWSETLEPRVMQVLVALAREQGGAVSRDELIEACWEGRIVGEDAISRCIWRLRKLAERSGGAFTVKTVSRVGYRLKVTAPQPVSQSLRAEPAAVATPSPPGASVNSARKTNIKWITAISAFVFMALAIGVWHPWLTRIAQPPSAFAEPSLAVLPFVNMSGDPQKDYFSDGFAEELVNDLSSNPHLRVASRTSSFAFKGRNEDISTIAKALRVQAIVEGSVRESGERVRITAQLIDANSGYHLWSAAYDRNLTDILAVQDEIGRAIASALTHRLTPEEAPGARRKIDPKTYRQYLQARQFLDENTPASARAALALLTLVTKQEPTFAEGFSALAVSQRYVAQYSNFSRPYGEPAAVAESAERALSLAPHNLEARVEREGYELRNWNWSVAATDLRALLETSPDNYYRLHGLRFYYYDLGFPEEALAVARRMSVLNPKSTGDPRQVATYLVHAGANFDAVPWLRSILAKEPNRTDMLDQMCQAYALSGQIRAATDVDNQLRRLASDWNSRNDSQDCDFYVDIAAHNFGAARKIVEHFESEFPDSYSSATDLAEYYVYLHAFDKASDWFERSYDQREFELFQDVYWKPAREYQSTARWKALTQRPAFRQWQDAHDRIAAALAARRDPLN